MSEAVARLHRLWPEFAGWSNYKGHYSGSRIDPQARAAVSAALEHIEVHADRFLRRDVIEQALRIAPPDMTVFRVAADLQRLIVRRCGVIVLDPPRSLAGKVLTTSTAGGISATIALEIDAALGEDVFLMRRRQALERLAIDAARSHVVLAPDRPTAQDLAARCGVNAIPVATWIAAVDGALVELESPEPLWRWWSGRTLLVDKAWTLPNIDIAVIFALARQLCVDLVLVDDLGRFAIDGPHIDVTYTRRMPRLPPRRRMKDPGRREDCSWADRSKKAR